jgi:hypothetical protein
VTALRRIVDELPPCCRAHPFALPAAQGAESSNST